MMWADYYSDGPVSSVAESMHSCIVNGLRVTCNNIWCGYEELFPTYDDAKVAAEVHSSNEG